MHQQLQDKQKYRKNALIFIVLLITFVACDGGIGVNGKVYTRNSSKNDSQCYIDEIPTLPSDLTPVKDAEIILYQADITKKEDRKGNIWTRSTVSNEKGEFTLGDTAAPFQFDATLVVKKKGFKPVSKVFPHVKNDSDKHDVVVILEAANDEKK
jgi:hypothetical protein